MEVTALSLLLYLVMNSSESGQARVSLTVSPERSQFFKYEDFTVSCKKEKEQREEEVEDGETEWRVMRMALDGEVRPCLFSCSITHAFPISDSGVYWCETGQGTTSVTVNITVTAGSVILMSPALPVTEGDDVTLCCRTTDAMSADSLTADFYRDGLLVATSSTGNMTIYSVSVSDDGLYRCNIPGVGESPDSQMTVRAPPAGRHPPAPLPVWTLLRHLIVGTPYLLSTVFLGLIYRHRKRGENRHPTHQISDRSLTEAGRPSDDVIMQIVM
ncbi:uncharacterized protein LOC130164676 [Seriola aureovittata]|uniref:uncharacterized protein LOC130164676 n=1 Tax=Seriola aureovittata TaxID=2871759 RepID=UPI0024BDDB65|nr:uncharacterized protein LOC130164676 [Seriola aureovittata]